MIGDIYLLCISFKFIIEKASFWWLEVLFENWLFCELTNKFYEMNLR